MWRVQRIPSLEDVQPTELGRKAVAIGLPMLNVSSRQWPINERGGRFSRASYTSLVMNRFGHAVRATSNTAWDWCVAHAQHLTSSLTAATFVFWGRLNPTGTGDAVVSISDSASNAQREFVFGRLDGWADIFLQIANATVWKNVNVCSQSLLTSEPCVWGFTWHTSGRATFWRNGAQLHDSTGWPAAPIFSFSTNVWRRKNWRMDIEVNFYACFPFVLPNMSEATSPTLDWIIQRDVHRVWSVPASSFKAAWAVRRSQVIAA